MYKSDIEVLEKLVSELRSFQEEVINSDDWHERVSFKIADAISNIEDSKENAFKEYISDLSNHFGYWGLYTTSEKTYKKKLEDLCVELEQKIKEKI